MTPIESIKATLEMAQEAIDRAQEAIDQALSRGVSGHAYLSALVKRRDDADTDARRILRLLEEKDLAHYRATQAAEFRDARN